MAIYSLIAGTSVLILIKLLRTLDWFDRTKWTLLKEIVSILLILTGTSIVIYIAGFFIEVKGDRWNLHTLLNSCKNVFSVGIIPYIFFSALNYRYLNLRKYPDQTEPYTLQEALKKSQEDLLQISSQLKKEELTFYPSQFLYAESDGNYVIFYLWANNQMKKQIIRNSISNIEQQLAGIPYILRTHRSFIVNMKKVTNKQGNILGYRLKLDGTDYKVPVSREKTKMFDNLFSQYHPN